jgi:hypothetical protein
MLTHGGSDGNEELDLFCFSDGFGGNEDAD